ncbi:hypothetical protein Kisp01_59950 [Kineosporia sp. NBRC 101677]|nr:hypothetical protein Kisp01_59950 [Kineosporia sp. NBRC 101677]
MVQSVAGVSTEAPGLSPRLVPAGQPGVQAAAVLALARAVLLSRLAASALYAATALLLNGVDGDSAQRYLLPCLIIAVVTLAECHLLRRMASGPPRVGLVLADSAVALVLFLVWTGDPVYVLFQVGAAALAGALLGLHGIPLWGGQAVQAAATCWLVLSDKVAPPLTTVVLVAAPGLIVAAGASTITLTRVLQDRLNRDLDPARPMPELYARVLSTLRTTSLSFARRPRAGRLADELARTLAQDTYVALERAATPIGGIRFDYAHEDFADPLEQLCQEWAAQARVSLNTDLPPVWLRVPVRHQLALIVDDALSNVAHHARATRARVELAERRHVVTLTIKDNGQGFDLPDDPAVLRGGGYDGICRMITRSSYLGADLTIITEPHSGTEIRVRMNGMPS